MAEVRTFATRFRCDNGEARPLRVDFNHRFDYGDILYSSVIDGSRQQFLEVEDLSLNADQQLRGPRGGAVNAWWIALDQGLKDNMLD